MTKKEMTVVRTVIRYEDKVLIVKRAPGMERAGAWELPGGKLDLGENLEEGARREVLEEVGINLENIDYLQSERYDTDDSQRLGVIFTAEVREDTVRLNSESDEYKWIDRSSYNNVSFEDHYQKFFETYFKTVVIQNPASSIIDKSTTNVQKLIIYTDGGSRGNPGPSASGFVIMNEREEVLEEGGEYLGITTNNQAEYQAVRQALEEAKKFGKVDVDFFIDSLLVVNQMNGIYKIKNRDLWPIHENIKKLAEYFKTVTYTHVVREKNKLADAKVNEVLDSYNHKDESEE